MTVRSLGRLQGFVLYQSEYQASPDNDTATQQTVSAMCEHVRLAATDPVVQRFAQDALNRLGPNSSERDRCAAAWKATKHWIHFENDEPLLAKLGKPDELELLVNPAVMVRLPVKDRKGDCDDFTMLLCALLQCMGGIQWNIVTIKANRADPEQWSHVYAEAILSDGRFPLDASHGPKPGLEAGDFFAGLPGTLPGNGLGKRKEMVCLTH
jgi:hypothetical protein